MKITPITDKANYLFPAAALLVGSTVLSACRQQPPLIGAGCLDAAGIYQQQQPVMGVIVGTLEPEPTEQEIYREYVRRLREQKEKNAQQKEKKP